jgi:hypothetical protein
MENMLDMDPNQFEEVLTKVLNQNRAISEERHKLDHDFTTVLRERYKKREAMWEKFRLSLIGGIAMMLLGGLTWIGKAVWDMVHKS